MSSRHAAILFAFSIFIKAISLELILGILSNYIFYETSHKLELIIFWHTSNNKLLYYIVTVILMVRYKNFYLRSDERNLNKFHIHVKKYTLMLISCWHITHHVVLKWYVFQDLFNISVLKSGEWNCSTFTISLHIYINIYVLIFIIHRTKSDVFYVSLHLPCQIYLKT